MPLQMADLGVRFASYVNESLLIVASTETLWMTAPPTSAVRRQLKVDRLEALYEAAFLRVFTGWEGFLEDALTHFMAGYRSISHTPQIARGQVRQRTIRGAQGVLYGNRVYLLWHDPNQAISRSRAHLTLCPVETVLTAAHTRLEQYAIVRHRIAHASSDAVGKFRQVAIAICGSDCQGKPGRLLRSADISDPLNLTKRIRLIADDMIGLAQSIVS
jgi:hypothetical protein